MTWTFLLEEGGSLVRSRASMLSVLCRCRTCSHSVSSKPTRHAAAIYTVVKIPDPCKIFKQLQQILANINNFWYRKSIQNLQMLFFKTRPTRNISNNFNTYWPISMTFCTQNLQRVSNVYICSLRVLMKQGTSLG